MEQVKENNENTGAGNETQIQSVQFSQLDSFNTPDLKDEGNVI